MAHSHACDVAVLTPSGRAAVASLAVYGPRAAELLTRFLHGAAGGPASWEVGRVFYRRWNDPRGEEVVACRRSADEFHVHCHGGTAAVERIAGELTQAGARRVTWNDWLKRQTGDPIERAALCALTQARTDRTADILLAQAAGALGSEIRAAMADLREDRAAAAEQRLRDVLAYADVGLHLTAGYRVVLAGPPNVGKSSLINALVGYQRAIVYDTPGTTRDVVTAETAIDGWPVELADTAGLRDAAADALEASGIRRARARLAEADLVVLVWDATRPAAAEDLELRQAFPQALQVANKWDLVESREQVHAAAGGLPAEAVICTSAATGSGVDDLLARIAARLVPRIPPPGAAVPFTIAQVAALRQACDDLAGGDVLLASPRLENLVTGQGQQACERPA